MRSGRLAGGKERGREGGDLEHVVDWNVFGDGDDEWDFGFDCFFDCCCGLVGCDEDGGGVGFEVFYGLGVGGVSGWGGGEREGRTSFMVGKRGRPRWAPRLWGETPPAMRVP